MTFLLSSRHVRLDLYDQLESSVYFNVGTDDPEFRNFAGIYSDRIFDTFHRFAQKNLRRGLPLVVAGGCGLNCDWNTRWRETGIFSDVFVPPVPNDSGSAIGTAIDAQLHLTGDAKIEWNVYSGLPFRTDSPLNRGRYDISDATCEDVARMLSSGLILGWVSGKYEIRSSRPGQQVDSCSSVRRRDEGAFERDQAARAVPTNCPCLSGS